MFKLLVDTCVWLDLAKDPRQAPVVSVVEELLRSGGLKLLVPQQVLAEFRRNREKLAKESARSLASHFRLVREAVVRAGGNRRRTKSVLSHLEDVNHKIPLIGGHAVAVLDRIEKLLAGSEVSEPTDDIRVRAAQRALEGKAPFHRGRNAMGDAIIIETYRAAISGRGQGGVRFAFVTHNKHDFSAEHANQNTPHPDLAPLFSRIKSLYFTNLVEALRRVDPTVVTEVMWEQSWSQEPRGLAEIVEAENRLFDQIWYNRHQNLRHRVRMGQIKLVEKETYPRPRGSGHETMQKDVWKLAKAAASRMEKRYQRGDLGPWDDFQWGMLNGKLSALRWVLGDEWDFLDT